MLNPGQLIEKYEVISALGGGGMAQVFKVRHSQLGSLHALKVLNPHLVENPELRQRFLAEGRIQAQLRHPHIVAITDIVAQPGVAGLVAEFIDGPTLSQYIGQQEGRSAPLAEVRSLFLQVLDGLGHAHAHGIVHRDIKPGNIMLEPRPDGTMRARLLDFGIAKLTGEMAGEGPRPTAAGARMGTLNYMSPEQIRGAADVDQRADIFSLAATMWEFITGQVPFDLPSEYETMKRIAEGGAPSERGFDSIDHQGLRGLLVKGMAPLPEDRYATCDEMAQALTDLADDRHSTQVLSRPTAPTPAPASTQGGDDALPGWARTLVEQYRAGRHSMFLIRGNTGDLVAAEGGYRGLPAFLGRLLARKELTVFYRPGVGLSFTRPAMEASFLRVVNAIGPGRPLERLPTTDREILVLLQRFLARRRAADPGRRGGPEQRVWGAVIVDPADGLRSVPGGLDIVRSWAAADAIRASDNLVLAIERTPGAVERGLGGSPRIGYLTIPAPDLDARLRFLAWLAARHGPAGGPMLAGQAEGLSLLQLERLYRRARETAQPFRPAWLKEARQTPDTMLPRVVRVEQVRHGDTQAAQPERAKNPARPLESMGKEPAHPEKERRRTESNAGSRQPSQQTGSQKTGSGKTGSQKTESQKTESQNTGSRNTESRRKPGAQVPARRRSAGELVLFGPGRSGPLALLSLPLLGFASTELLWRAMNGSDQFLILAPLALAAPLAGRGALRLIAGVALAAGVSALHLFILQPALGELALLLAAPMLPILLALVVGAGRAGAPRVAGAFVGGVAATVLILAAAFIDPTLLTRGWAAGIIGALVWTGLSVGEAWGGRGRKAPPKRQLPSG